MNHLIPEIRIGWAKGICVDRSVVVRNFAGQIRFNRAEDAFFGAVDEYFLVTDQACGCVVTGKAIDCREFAPVSCFFQQVAHAVCASLVQAGFKARIVSNSATPNARLRSINGGQQSDLTPSAI